MNPQQVKTLLEAVLEETNTISFVCKFNNRELARRTVCGECQFETGLLDERESHAPGCSKVK